MAFHAHDCWRSALDVGEGDAMLSHHELSTLLLLKDATEHIEPDCLELGALRDLQLVEVEPPESGQPLLRVTQRGYAVLRAFARAA
ncbi:hypothetical protein [Burkholderia sp. Ax-1719]|uniref:hypothetical protein n=1 Tax=Burkholderia sp. Ax-1719 TaxID=2608334 RepID=UPI001F048F2F|nr:hypothetical protein [Burkholderia sp. Ax-1719]